MLLPGRSVPSQAVALAALALCLLSPVRSALAAGFPKPDAQGTVEVGLPVRASTLVLFLSGDGGWWGDLDAQLAARLVKERYAVVGLDTDVWFTEPRSVEDIATRLSAMARHYCAVTKAPRLALIGYSFGADVLPLAFERMPRDLTAKTTAIVLIAPERKTTLQVTAFEQSGIDPGDIDLDPSFARLPKSRTVCIYGLSETGDTGCTEDGLEGADLIGLPGGHHFNNDIASLFAKVSEALRTHGELHIALVGRDH